MESSAGSAPESGARPAAESRIDPWSVPVIAATVRVPEAAVCLPDAYEPPDELCGCGDGSTCAFHSRAEKP